MTTLIRWGGNDQRRQSSIYLASDSRFTVAPGRFHSGQKVYACRQAPFIFGFCGCSGLPTVAFPGLLKTIDETHSNGGNISEGLIINYLTSKIAATERIYPILGNCKIVICGRSGENMAASFFSFGVEYYEGTIQQFPISYDKDSNYYVAWGSGQYANDRYNARAKEFQHLSAGYSRSVFSAFCDSIESNIDGFSSPPPQLVGLYASGNAQEFGIFYNGSLYKRGFVATDINKIQKCVDRHFQNIDPETKVLILNAQIHANESLTIKDVF